MKIKIQFKPWKKPWTKKSKLEVESKAGGLKVFQEDIAIKKTNPFCYATDFEREGKDGYQVTVTGSFNPSDIYCDITRNGFVITDTKFQFGTKFEDRIKTELQGEL